VNATVFGSESLAVDFLGEFARLPYETSDPDQAGAFVLEHLVTEGELPIGDAIIGIYNDIDGTPPEVYFLQIRSRGEDLVTSP
jgi:hypothetical protein